MRPSLLRILYIIIGLFSAYMTVQRVLAAQWGGALFTGAIAAFCGYRLYTLYARASSQNAT